MVVLLLAAAARLQAASNDENAVRTVVTQEIEAWQKHDAKAVSSLYTVDAVWQNPFGVRLKSSAALEKFLLRLFQRPGYLAAKETSEAAITDLHFAAPTVAVVWSEESSKDQIDDATGKPMLPRHSHYIEVLVKQAGGWKISECMIMDEIPR